MFFFSTALTILCSRTLSPVREVLECTFSNKVTEVSCSYDNLPAEECTPHRIALDSSEFGSDQHTLTIHATDIFNQTLDHIYTFELMERKYRS